MIRPHPTGRDEVSLLEAELFVEALSRQQIGEMRGFALTMVHSKLQTFCGLNDFSSISALQGAVLRDPGLAGDICRYVSLHDCAMLRSDLLFNALHYAATPMLRSSPWPSIWLSECADAGLVRRVLSMLEAEGLGKRSRVFITHSNERLLTETMELVLPQGAGRVIGKESGWEDPEHDPVHQLKRKESEIVLCGGLSSATVWAQHDFVTDGSFNEFNVVVCCRALNAYLPVIQDRALALFDESLSNFGILQIEPSGEVHNKAIHAFTAVLGEQGIYRKTPKYGLRWARNVHGSI